jgi:hypothetical protein
MRRGLFFLATFLIVLALSGCPRAQEAARRGGVVSIRGWVTDAVLPPGSFRVVGTNISAEEQRRDILDRTNLAVEGVQFASGAMRDTGSFIILDVPPGDVTILFQVPILGDVPLHLGNVPPSADVLIPGILLSDEGASVPDPSGIRVRVPSREPAPLNIESTVAGHRVPAVATPLRELADRRDFPEPGAPANLPRQ